MDNKTEIEQLDSHLPPKLQFENAADAIGLCFAAAVLCAVLAAGLIIYRGGGNTDVVTASNTAMPAAAHSDPLSPPLLPQR